jgi:hypothetical protein
LTGCCPNENLFERSLKKFFVHIIIWGQKVRK